MTALLSLFVCRLAILLARTGYGCVSVHVYVCAAP